MEELPLEIINLIFEELDLKSKLRLMATSHFHAESLIITDLTNIDEHYPYSLNDSILKQSKYLSVTKLDAGYNRKITDVSHLTALKILNAKSARDACGIKNCGINQKGISTLNLTRTQCFRQ